jgi:hypothetical protein
MKSISTCGVLALTMLCGCTIPQYHQADGPRSALLKFPDHKNTLNQTIEFNAFTNANCEPGPDDGQLAFFNSFRKLPEPVRIQVDKRLYIRQTYGRAGAGSNLVSCMSMASFIPEAGKTYSLSTHYVVEQSSHLIPILYSVSCEMNIIDATNGIQVATYETLPACVPQKR